MSIKNMRGVNKQTKAYRVFFPLVIIMSIGCSKSSVSVSEYFTYIKNPNNGLLRESEFSDYRMAVQYKPAEYGALLNLGPSTISDSTFKEETRNLSSWSCFEVRFSGKDGNEFLKSGIRSENEYFFRVEHLSSRIIEDFKLVTAGDTLDCAIHHYERNYGLTQEAVVHLAFVAEEQNKNDLLLIYNDRFLDVGQVKFRFKANDLRKIPSVLING